MAKSRPTSRAQSRAINRLLRAVEHKSITSTSATAPTTAGFVVNTTVVAEGDGVGDRTGKKIFIEKVRLRFNQLATATNNTRILLLRDRFNLGTVPAVTDILTSASVGAPYNHDTVLLQKRFKVYLDVTKSYSLNGTLAGYEDRTFLVNQPAFWSGAASTDEGSGLIWMLVITDAAASSAIDIKIQTIFTDA